MTPEGTKFTNRLDWREVAYLPCCSPSCALGPNSRSSIGKSTGAWEALWSWGAYQSSQAGVGERGPLDA